MPERAWSVIAESQGRQMHTHVVFCLSERGSELMSSNTWQNVPTNRSVELATENS